MKQIFEKYMRQMKKSREESKLFPYKIPMWGVLALFYVSIANIPNLDGFLFMFMLFLGLMQESVVRSFPSWFLRPTKCIYIIILGAFMFEKQIHWLLVYFRL